MLQSFTLPEATDASDEKLLADVAEYGWHIVFVAEEEGSPPFAFTVGLYYSYGHPEILLMGLRQNIAHALLAAAVEKIKAGGVLEPGRLHHEIANFPMATVRMSLTHYPEYLGYAGWFYSSIQAQFPTVQLMWPDKAGLFPWQTGYDEKFKQLQKDLGDAL